MILDLTNLTVDQLKLLNNVSVEIHDDFNKLSEEILNSTPKNIVDLVANIVSRHPYQSSLYKICYTLEFIKQYLKKNKGITQIYTDDYELYTVIKYYYPKYMTIFNGKNKTKQKLKILLKPFIDSGQNFITIKREVLSRDFKRKFKIKSLNSVILIDTFLLQKSIENNKFIDRYYTGILDYLDENLKSKIFFVPHILPKYSKKNLDQIIHNSEENLVFKHDFLKISDYFRSIVLLFKHKVNENSKFYFREFDLTNFIIKSIRQSRFNPSTFHALNNYFFINRLRDEKIDVNLFIDWNENQPIDKGLIKGIHDFFPEVKVKGYRAFIISRDYNLYLMPTQYEVDNKVIPDEIVVTGESLINGVKKFTGNIKVISGPTFRFMNIYEPHDSNLIENENILVALPIGFDDSVEIIKNLTYIEKVIDFDRYKVLIKPHPTTSLDKLKGAVATQWRPNFTWADGSFRDNILKSWLIIGNTTSAILEALAYGVPGIIVGSRTTVTQNPIPSEIDKLIWRKVYSAEELAKAISFYIGMLKKEKEMIQEIGREIKRKYFVPATKKGVKIFLDLN